ncbi:DUF4296 domain-containing protein [Lutimonas vermicola]|uniref:DUF4296 domain-containing protein n=1 Tax=Lutimonas vermicola TaxID=414288 RepID=A0ABU9L4T8_9FLAO
MKILYSFILILFLFACQDKGNYKKPENLISKSKMTDLLLDMHLVVGTSNVQNIYLEKNRNYMSLVYEKYGVDSTQFAQSNLYYTSQIGEYEEIFEEVHRRMKILKETYESRMDSIMGLQETEKKANEKRDSIIEAQRKRQNILN